MMSDKGQRLQFPFLRPLICNIIDSYPLRATLGSHLSEGRFRPTSRLPPMDRKQS